MNLKRLLIALVLPLVMLCMPALAQDKLVTGKITSAKDGSPVIGATITIKGTKSGTAAGQDGSFSLRVPASATTLVISSVGYASQEVAVGTGIIEVQLVETNTALTDVVVIGYGTQRKKDVTGAAVSVSAKDFVKGPIVSPEQLINGKVAGVQITPGGGAPGAGSRILIRGGSSLAASNNPLIVIDGVPVDESGIAGSANPLNMINPNDIETFNVLKDASAAAIYGSRASNGVIIITTKKGKKGKPQFSFNTNLSISTVGKTADILSADEFRAVVNARGTAQQKARLGNASTNWQDEIYRTAIMTDNNLSVTGSAGKMPYRLSVGYLNQDGILKTDNMQRITAAVNLSPSFMNDHMKVNLNVKGTSTKNKFANQGAIGNAVSFDPTQPVLSGNNRFGGYWEWLNASNQPNQLSQRNPMGLLNLRNDQSDAVRSIGNLQVDYKFHFLPELRANLNLGYDVARGKGSIFVPDSAAQAYFQGGVNNQYNQNNTNTLAEFYLNYAKDLRSINSRIDLTAGYSFQSFRVLSDTFPNRRANGTVINYAGRLNEPFQNSLMSYYARLVYTYNGKYILTATIRRDGSTRFGLKGDPARWGTFPAIAAAWRISEEDFMKNSKVFNDLKLRAAYGVNGNQSVGGSFPFLPIYSQSNLTASYQFGNTFYQMQRPSAYDPQLKWEQLKSYNIGIDFSMFNNKINGSIDYFNKDNEDLLNTIPIPVGTNFSNVLTTNVGTLNTRGLEFTLNTNLKRTKDLNWDFGFNLTFLDNEIKNLTRVFDPNYPGAPRGFIAGGTGNFVQINSVGYRPGSFYVYKQVYDKNNNPIENLFEDRNRDGVINEKDRYRYMSPEPDVLLGVNSSLSYKKWTAGFVLRGSFGNYMYNNFNSVRGTYFGILDPNGFLANASRRVLTTNFTTNSVEQLLSDYHVENASFLRMDNINVGYNVGKIAKGINMRASLNVQNAFIITKYTGIDPEIAGGIDNNLYPRPRMFVLGVNLDF